MCATETKAGGVIVLLASGDYKHVHYTGTVYILYRWQTTAVRCTTALLPAPALCDPMCRQWRSK